MTFVVRQGRLREGESNIMTGQGFKVGIVGLQPGRSWAARAHVPALRALSETFEIVGVANTSLASAEKAAAATGLPRAFADVAELIAAPEVDIHCDGEGAPSCGDREGGDQGGQAHLLRMATRQWLGRG